MMDTTAVAQAVEAWAAAATGFNSFPNQPEHLNKALPIVIADVQRERVAQADSDFPDRRYEQTLVRAMPVQVVLLVTPNPPWTADQALYDAVDALSAALRDDRTLGQRVITSAPTYEAEYPGEVQHEDGTVARMATFQVIVGEQVEGN